MSLSFRDSNGILHEIASKSLTDSFLSNSSENPVKNKTIYYALENKVEKATQDLVHYYLKSETYSKEEVNSLIGSISSLDLAVVATLPTQDISTTTIYLVGPDSETGKYDEYVYFNNSWVQIGDTSIDLSGYVTSSELTAAIADFLTETEIRSLVQTCYTKIETNALLDTKQDVLTFDNAPIENSTNPVKSGGVYTALFGKQDTLTYDNLPTENSTNMVKSGGIYTAINSLGAEVISYDNTESTLSATDVQSAIDELGENGVESRVSWDDFGKSSTKNLNLYPYYHRSQTINGVTFTINPDYSVVANGIATADTTFNFHTRASTKNALILPNGSYILSGCPITGSATTYRINANRTENGVSKVYGSDVGNGLLLELNGDDYFEDKVRLGVYIYINNGTTLDNIVFKPMIRLASDVDDTYYPYARSNSELTAASIAYDNLLGAKNLVPYPYYTSSATIEGITWTTYSDGRVVANGTSEGLSIFDVINTEYFDYFSLKEGVYTLSDNLGVENYEKAYTAITLMYSDDSVEYNFADTSINKVNFVIQNSSNIKNFYLGLCIKPGKTVSNLTFYPMIRPYGTDCTYVPYAQTNLELTSKISGFDSEFTDIYNLLGSKNICPNTATSNQINGITFTVNSNGSIVANGTASGDAILRIYLITSDNLAKMFPSGGKYIVSTNISDANLQAFFGIMYTNSTWDVNVWLSSNSPSANITIDGTKLYDSSRFEFYVKVPNGKTVSNAYIYPMLRPASIEDDTYVPYAMPNKKLTDAVTKTVSPSFSKIYSDATVSIYKIGQVVNLRVDILTPATTGWCTISNNVPKSILSQIIGPGIYNSGTPCTSFLSVTNQGRLDVVVHSGETSKNLCFTICYLTSD